MSDVKVETAEDLCKICEMRSNCVARPHGYGWFLRDIIVETCKGYLTINPSGDGKGDMAVNPQRGRDDARGVQISNTALETPEGEFECYYCKHRTDYDTVEVSFGYGSKFDMDGFLFCSDDCFVKWVKETFMPSAGANVGEKGIDTATGRTARASSSQSGAPAIPAGDEKGKGRR